MFNDDKRLGKHTTMSLLNLANIITKSLRLKRKNRFYYKFENVGKRIPTQNVKISIEK